MPEFTGTKDLGGYLAILWRWKFLFLFFLIATPLIAYLVESSQAAVYQSKALVGVSQTTVSNSTLAGGAGGSFTTANPTAIAQLVTTTPVAEAAASMFHPPADPSQIASEVTATGDTTTDFVTITAEDRNPSRAAAIANAFAHAIGANQQQAGINTINTNLAGLRSQLRHLGPNDPAALQIQQQISTLEAARGTQGSNAVILQAATPASAAVGLNTHRVLEIGLLIGLLLGLGAVVLANNADRRLRTPADLERMANLPLLAAIPSSAFSAKLDAKQDEETFHMLRTALAYFRLDTDGDHGTAGRGGLSSILITSPGEKEGKTTVAVGLALAIAAAGLRVTVIDADLRRAQLGPRFGIAEKTGLNGVRATETGLGAVLAGESTLEDVLVRYPLDDTDGQLMIVPAGPLRRKPGVLVGSEAMRAVLAAAESASDLVIIDSPAALAISDSVPLMELVSGVVLVARMEHSTRAAVARVQKVVQRAGGVTLGVVATGVTRIGYGYYYSPKYYMTNGGRRGRRGAEGATAPEGQELA